MSSESMTGTASHEQVHHRAGTRSHVRAQAENATPRQHETFRRVLAAGTEVLRECSYAGLSMRAVANRAGVSPATAYTYFSSKNHLIAEIYLDLVSRVPFFTDVNEAMTERVQQTLRALTLVVADEPEVAAACTTALLSGGGEASVRRARARIGTEIHRRITSAIGPGADAGMVSALEMTFFGALVNAGSGAYTYRQVAERLSYVVGLILDRADSGDDRAKSEDRGESA